jgi:N-glycosylase/DNA lyase
LEKLKGLRLGLDKETKIYQAAIAVHSGNINLEALAAEPSSEKVNRALRHLYGVGDKVANCVSLFALEKLDAFPVDTHIGHNLQKLYGEESGYPRSRTQRTTVLRKWAQHRFGRYSGYAETFLFIDDLRGDG